jgi:hypothetical protein
VRRFGIVAEPSLAGSSDKVSPGDLSPETLMVFWLGASIRDRMKRAMLEGV